MAVRLFHWCVASTLMGWTAISVALLWRATPKASALTLGDRSALSGVELLDRFDRRFKAYEALLKRLDRILAFQVTLVALALFVASRGRTIETVKMFNVDVSVELLCVLVPIGLLYSWARFGFVLSTLIDSRRALWMILDELQDPRQRGIALTLRSTIRDVGLVDAMIAVFYPNDADFVQFAALRYINIGCYIFFMAAANTALLGTFLLGSLRSTVTGLTFCWLFTMLCAAAWLTVTHLQFAVIHPSRHLHSIVITLTGIGAVSVYLLSL